KTADSVIDGACGGVLAIRRIGGGAETQEMATEVVIVYAAGSVLTIRRTCSVIPGIVSIDGVDCVGLGSPIQVIVKPVIADRQSYQPKSCWVAVIDGDGTNVPRILVRSVHRGQNSLGLGSVGGVAGDAINECERDHRVEPAGTLIGVTDLVGTAGVAIEG